MSNLKLPPLTHEHLSKRVRESITRRGVASVNLAYATKVTQEPSETHAVVLWHHKTPIALIGARYLTLNNGGYHTVTTAARLHKLLTDNDTGYGVRIKQGIMTIIEYDDAHKPVNEYPMYGSFHLSRASDDSPYVLHR